MFVWSALAAGMLRFATPLIFGAMGGILSERSGVINIGLEGMMLMGAFFGIFGADLFGSWFLGVLVGLASGALMGLIHAFVSIRLRADQVVSGTGINILAHRHHRLRLHLPLRQSGHALRHLARAERDAPAHRGHPVHRRGDRRS